MPDVDLVRTPDLIEATGVTARQLDYWTSMRYVRAARPARQGKAQMWTFTELRVVTLMHRLTIAGFPVAVAAVYARMAVDEHRSSFKLGGGVTLTINQDGTP